MTNFKQEYRKIKNQIFSHKNPLLGIKKFFKDEHMDVVSKFAPALCKEEFFREVFVGKKTPESISLIGNSGNMPLFLDFEKAMLWCFLGLKSETSKINEFLVLRKKFDRLFLLGEYQKCLEVLKESNNKFGHSMWEIKNRIAVLSEKEGIDAQKNYTKGVLNELKFGSVPYYLIYCFSKQCERNVSVTTFLGDLNSNYDEFLSSDLPIQLCQYAKYKAGGYIEQNDVDFLNLNTLSLFMFYDDKCSLIDRYISLCDILVLAFENKIRILCDILITYIEKLSTMLSDDLLDNFVFYYHKHYYKFHPNEIDRIYLALDYYSKGEYIHSLNVAKELLYEDVRFFPLIELCAKCAVYLPTTTHITKEMPIIERIIFRLKQLFSRSGDIEEVIIDLIKMLYTQLGTTWAAELLHIIKKYKKRLIVFEPVNEYCIHSSISMPDSIFSLGCEYLNKYISQTTTSFQESITTQLAIAVITGDIVKLSNLSIDPVRKSKYMASMLIEKDSTKAIRILESNIGDVSLRAVRQEFDAMRIKAFLRVDRLLDAMRVFVYAFIDNRNFIHIGSISQIYNKIKSGDYDVKNSIFTPIICSIYFNHYLRREEHDDVVLSICYEEYLESCGVQKPSELLSQQIDMMHSPESIQFFSEVCVPSVMDRSLSFAYYDEVLRERIIICEALIKYDQEYAEKYTDEIRHITNILLARLAKREIENSKIYINIEGIRRLLFKEAYESYERYIDYWKNNIKDHKIQIINSINKKYKGINVSLSNENPISMLEAIIKRIRDIYVADNMYGLDGCLSVRIRHGTIESILRSCFEKHKLITTRALDGSYNANRFWIEESTYQPKDEAKIYGVFSEFSSTVDSIITHLKNKLIQIKTENKNPEGLFDFSINEQFVSVVESKLHFNSSFDSFLDITLEMLATLTENSLNTVRSQLVSDINFKFQEALQKLEKELKLHEKIFNFQGLRDHIAKSRTDISTELKNISEWFKLTQPDGFDDYQLVLAASISCDIMQYSHSNCTLYCDIEAIDKKIFLKGNTLRNIVDVFTILLDNVIKHSGFSKYIRARIFAEQKNNIIDIVMENCVRPGSVDCTRLQQVERQLTHWESQGYINIEGGSGLHKIKKILSVDMLCRNYICLSCKDNVFSIKITLEMGDCYENTNS